MRRADPGSGSLGRWCVRTWTRLYTLGLPPRLRGARIDEVRSDLWEHQRDLAERGPSRRAPAAELVGRLVRGIPGDLAWRRTVKRDDDLLSPTDNGSMNALLIDLRAVARRLLADRLHVALVVATLAVGIVATTIVFSIVNTVLLGPLPYADADRLAMMRIDIAGIERHPGLLRAEVVRLRSLPSIEAAESSSRTFSVAMTGDSLAAFTGASVSPGLFPMLGAIPALGRPFNEEDATLPGNRVLISDRAWQGHFGADPSVVGSTVELFGRPTEIIGVMPADFRLDAGRGSDALAEVDIWFPLFVDPDDFTFWGFRTIVRLRPGSLGQARGEIAALAVSQQAERPDAYGDQPPTYYIAPLHDDLTADVRPRIWALFATVGVVLLVACSSAAGLVVARARGRATEFALRSALGAAQRRLLRQMLLESLALGALVALVAVPLSIGGLALFLDLEPGQLPRAADVGVDARVLSFGVGLALLASVVSGCLPAWQSSRVDAAETLRQGRRSAGPVRRGTRGALVVAQLGFCFALVVSAGLLLRTFMNLTLAEPGFRHEGVLTAELGIDWRAFADRADRWEAFRQLTESLRDLPSVEAAGAVTHVPLGPRGLMASFSTTGIPENAGWSDQAADFRFVVPGYFDAIGLPLESGRAISVDDNEQLRPVVVIDATLAEQAYPGEEAVGKIMHIGIDGIDPALADPTLNDWTAVEIIGVVRHARITDLRQDGRPQIYLPYRYRGDIPVYVTARVVGDTDAAVAGLRDAVEALGFNHPVENVRMLGDYVADHRATEQFLITLLGALASVAVMLSGVGVYGVVATVARERRTEIGVRKALGARGGQLLAMNLRDGLVMGLGGVALGLVAAPVLGGSFRRVLYGVPATDAATYVVAVALLLAIALAASFVPALRAARIAPSQALRDD